jgi:hypothetical protein
MVHTKDGRITEAQSISIFLGMNPNVDSSDTCQLTDDRISKMRIRLRHKNLHIAILGQISSAKFLLPKGEGLKKCSKKVLDFRNGVR